MDVEKIQRINNLAVELERQGLATDREDAVAQARRIFNVEDHSAIDPSQMQTGSLQAKTEEPEELTQQEDNQSTLRTTLNDEKIAEILQKNSSFMVSTIKKFQTKIEHMEQEMLHMKRKMQELASRPVAQTVTAPESETQNTAPKESTSTNPQGGDHPRSGGYNAGDVSIEKFFYMGTK